MYTQPIALGREVFALIRRGKRVRLSALLYANCNTPFRLHISPSDIILARKLYLASDNKAQIYLFFQVEFLLLELLTEAGNCNKKEALKVVCSREKVIQAAEP